MKNLILIAFSVCVISGPVFADQPASALFVKKVGGIAHVGTVETCEIFPNNPKISQRLDEINRLVISAQTKGELELIANFAKAQIPTEEIYANRVVLIGGPVGSVRIQKVELVKVFGAHEIRTSKEAKELIELVEELCP